MRLDSQDGLRGTFTDPDTGRQVRYVRWYDDETGEYEAFRINPELARARGIPLRSVLYRGRAWLHFTPAQPLERKPVGRIAAATPMEEIRREVLKGGEILPNGVRRILWLPGSRPPECDEPLCHRWAEWSVSVEQMVEPEPDRGAPEWAWERAVTVATSVWCSWHYRPPRRLSIRGVESEVEVEARPQ